MRALALLRLNDRLTAPRVATLLELTGEGVRKIARRYRESGIDEAVYEGERPGKKPVLDAAQRLKVVALACSRPPAGQAPWTIRLRAAEVKKRNSQATGTLFLYFFLPALYFFIYFFGLN